MKKKVSKNQGNLKVLNRGKKGAQKSADPEPERRSAAKSQRSTAELDDFRRLERVKFRICTDPDYRFNVLCELCARADGAVSVCTANSDLCGQLYQLLRRAYAEETARLTLWNALDRETALQRVLFGVADTVEAEEERNAENASLTPIPVPVLAVRKKAAAELPEREKTEHETTPRRLKKTRQRKTAAAPLPPAAVFSPVREERTMRNAAPLTPATVLSPVRETRAMRNAAPLPPAAVLSPVREDRAMRNAAPLTPAAVFSPVREDRTMRNAEPLDPADAESQTPDLQRLRDAEKTFNDALEEDGAAAPEPLDAEEPKETLCAVQKPVVVFPADEIVVTATGHRNPLNGGLYCTYLFEPTDEGVRKAILGYVCHSELSVDENCLVGGLPALRMRYRDPLGYYSSATAYGRTRGEKWYNLGTAMGLTRYFNLLRQGCTKKPSAVQIKTFARLLGGGQTGMRFEGPECLTPLRCTRFELRDDQPWNITVETAAGLTVLFVEEGHSHSQRRQIHALLDAARDSSDTRPTDPRWNAAFSLIAQCSHRSPAIQLAASYNGFLADPRNRNRLRNFVNALPE